MKIVFNYPTEQDIMALSIHMRTSDIQELCIVTDLSVYDAVKTSVSNSDEELVFTVTVNDKLVCIAGCTVTGNPWLMATNEIEKYRKMLTQESRKWLKIMLLKYGYLHNIVDCRNKRTIKWLSNLGFELSDEFALNNAQVIRFEMRL